MQYPRPDVLCILDTISNKLSESNPVSQLWPLTVVFSPAYAQAPQDPSFLEQPGRL